MWATICAKVNPEIWYKMPGHAKKKDIKLANLQDYGGLSLSFVFSTILF